MSVLLSFAGDERRVLASGALAPLVRALRAELEPLVEGHLPIPEQKARLTRIGGRCAFDGTLLGFDPWTPHEHKCPQCHRVFIDRAHDDWWAMGAQLWTAERAAQAAALYAITDDNAMRVVALRILRELAERYRTWPNKDNALGPTRPFFSTYLESIWLINLCHAISLLEQKSDVDSSALNGVRNELVLPSRNLIASFHEGRSNRQVWNEVAVLSASRILGDDKTFAERLNSHHGLFDLLGHGLLDDGTWYEGENYHLFAHRGLWYGMQLLRAANHDVPENLEMRYRAGFVTPFLGVLPDDTLPSRRDSQYKVSIRQWRFAEWCEMGIAHALSNGVRPDERLVGTLHRLYHADNSSQLTAQNRHAFSTADAERNEPAGLLSRADLSWRSLLMATPILPEGDSWSPASICLPQQGLAVIRRDAGQTYIALEGGHTGGGHGHPDRLALTAQRGLDRWLEDPGTGSYVEEKLHWYRSTLAHAAPLVDGASQDAVPARLLAFEDRGGAGWMCKRVENVKPGVNIQRTVVVCDGYFIDLLEWDADRVVTVDLPIPRSFELPGAFRWQSADPKGAGGLEDGFDFLSSVEVDTRSLTQGSFTNTSRFSQIAVRTVDDDRTAMVDYSANTPITVWRAEAPGSPGHDRAPLHWVRMVQASGRVVGVWSWRQPDGWSTSANVDGTFEISVTTGETQSIHTRTDLGWHIALKARHATSSIDLPYLSHPESADEPETQVPAPLELSNGPEVTSREVIDLHDFPHTSTFDLAEPHYLRTEQTWAEAGEPAASVLISILDDVLDVTVFTVVDDIVVPSLDEENLLDNERRDVNADGVELFIGPKPGAPWSASWLIVPAAPAPINADPAAAAASIDDSMPARSTATTAGSPAIRASWLAKPTQNRVAWMIRLQLPVDRIPIQSDGTFAMEIIVNERPANRARRRGQLVLSGGGGFSYLRGDRADSSDAFIFRLPSSPNDIRADASLTHG